MGRYDEMPEKPTKAQMAEAEFFDRASRREVEPSDARISSQLAFMTEQLSKTQAIFSELANRLDPILVPEMDSPMNAMAATAVPRKMASDISNTIDDLNSQVCRLQDRMMIVLERVQL